MGFALPGSSVVHFVAATSAYHTQQPTPFTTSQRSTMVRVGSTGCQGKVTVRSSFGFGLRLLMFLSLHSFVFSVNYFFVCLFAYTAYTGTARYLYAP